MEIFTGGNTKNEHKTQLAGHKENVPKGKKYDLNFKER